ncbi:hypothetical protein HanRHA438_Chr03g0101251 [Helianthus annuus]|nr:hypothetical protein HanRHA438_Chr03g0101251 [Helianthus annuus]
MSDTDFFYYRPSYGTWCHICGGPHKELECYFLNYKPHYIDPLFSCSLKRGESKNNPYLSLECSQSNHLGEMLLDELFQLEDLILNWIKELEVDFGNSSQDDTQEELLGSHSNKHNFVVPDITSNSSEDLSDSRPCVDCAVKDSPSTSFGAYIDLSDSTYTFFNESPGKGWTCPPTFSIGITLTDNLLRSRLNLEQLRYLRNFAVVPSNKEPPNPDKFLKNRRISIDSL